MSSWPPLLLLGSWALLSAAVGRHYPHSAVLDGASRYRLSWAPQGGAIAFRLEVRTQGYVGFGFSPTGAMTSADIVVGGLDRGKPYLQSSKSTMMLIELMQNHLLKVFWK
uniref:DBH-like monooxygenase protein 1 n=1 Tax=Sphaerodactylus townsendi TaxID=933632 RepID=A0ACB8GC84_9SAUR